MSRSPLRRAKRAALVGLLLLVTLAVETGSAGPYQFPDLRPRKPGAGDVGIGPADFEPAVRALRFSTMTENVGSYPLEVIGVPSAGLSLEAHQCNTWVARICTSYQPAGTMVFDEFHRHWHFEGFAQYELRYLQGGQPDLDRAPAATGSKASFCLMDSHPTPDLPEESQDRLLRLYPPTCPAVRQGISPGWMDMYTTEVVGQQIRLVGVPDGDYALVIRIDPDNRLAESNEGNNMTFRAIRISGTQVILL